MGKILRAQLSVRLFTDEKCFGPGIAELLRQVDSHRSLRAAAQSMKMAYSKAWTIMHNAEKGLGFRLLDVRTGGKNGGGAVLTEEARRMLAAYDRYCRRLREESERIFAQEFDFYGELTGE